MSLLLDALKKAEKAKEDAARRNDPGAGKGLSLEGEDDSPIEGKHVLRKNELPDISRPLEIHSEDLVTGEGGARPQLSLEEPVAPTPKAASAPPNPATPPRRPENRDSARQGAQEIEQQRASAKMVFEAKFKEPNPKLPFYITMAILGICALGTVVYFWYQLRPPPSLVNTNPPKPSGEAVVVSPPVAVVPSSAPAAVQADSAPIQLPGMPDVRPAQNPPAAVSASTVIPTDASSHQASATKPVVTPAAISKPESVTRSTTRPTDRRAAQATPVPTPSESSKVNVSRGPPQVSPKLNSAWKAYNEGKLEVARAGYLEVIKEEPGNRDALLGLAAIDTLGGRLEQAEASYRRILDNDPRDAHAQAGLLGLRAQLVDPVQTESRVKSLLAAEPDSHVLNFTLGNQYALQGRWPEAQQAYFKAFAADPENPDFAYNLAVSLDQLRQPRLALEYYKKALALAQQRVGNFDQALARNRVQSLSR